MRQSNLAVMGLPLKLDWDRVRVGESFFVPAPTGVTQVLRPQLRAEAKDIGYDVVIEEVAEDDLMGLRVWRIA